MEAAGVTERRQIVRPRRRSGIGPHRHPGRQAQAKSDGYGQLSLTDRLASEEQHQLGRGAQAVGEVDRTGGG